MSGIDEAAANESCVGPSSERAGKASGCEGCPNQKACAEGKGREEDPDLAVIRARLSSVKRKVLVLSGKGGVGKSTMSAQLAFALAADGLRVGLLDIDICGPSIPQMLGLRGQTVHQSASGWSPVYVTQSSVAGADTAGDGEGGGSDNDDDIELGVMSIGFMLPSEDDAVVWRGPRKNGLIKQFLTDVDWGALDYLLVDTPPGTSDEHISLVQYLAKALGEDDGALVRATQPTCISARLVAHILLATASSDPAGCDGSTLVHSVLPQHPDASPALFRHTHVLADRHDSTGGLTSRRTQGAFLLREDKLEGARCRREHVWLRVPSWLAAVS